MSGQEARVWPIDDAWWTGQLVATADGVRLTMRRKGRPSSTLGLLGFSGEATGSEITIDLTPSEVETRAKGCEDVAGLLREAAAAARKLGAK